MMAYRRELYVCVSAFKPNRADRETGEKEEWGETGKRGEWGERGTGEKEEW